MNDDVNVNEIKEWLVKQLPEFNFMTGEEANQPAQNQQSIRIERDGLAMVLDVRKVDSDDAKGKLKAYITDMWRRSNETASK